MNAMVAKKSKIQRRQCSTLTLYKILNVRTPRLSLGYGTYSYEYHRVDASLVVREGSLVI